MGTKRLFDLIPRSLVKRLREERKRIWSIHQRTAVSAATQELAAWKTKHGGKGGGGEEVQREKEELEARLQVWVCCCGCVWVGGGFVSVRFVSVCVCVPAGLWEVEWVLLHCHVCR